jgi:hypothetical protein
MLKKPSHDKGTLVARIVSPGVHALVVPLKAIVHVHVTVEVFARHVTLRHFVRVGEAREAVAPGQLAIVVEEEAALCAFALF